jgi:hypothetical protein
VESLEELKEFSEKLKLYTFSIIKTLDSDNNDLLNKLYKDRKYIKFKIYNYKYLQLLTEDEVKKAFELYEKASKKRTAMKQNIKKKLKLMDYPAFITITFTDKALKKQIRNNLRIFFKQYNIRNYILISDYGKETNRFHFHGFIDLARLDKDLFRLANFNTNKTKTNYFNFIPLEQRFGFNLISSFNDYKRMINYATKYMIKDYTLKHETFSSRSGDSFILNHQYRLENYKKELKKNKNFFSFEKI